MTLLGEEENGIGIKKISRIIMQIMELFTCGINSHSEFSSVGRNS